MNTTIDTTAKKRTQMNIDCEGLNLINQFAKDTLINVLPQMEKLIGQKIVLANGDKSAKFVINDTTTKKTGEAGKWVEFQYWFDLSGHSIWLECKLCLNGGSYDNNTAYCTYFKKQIYIGTIKNQILETVSSLEDVCKNSIQEPITEDAMCKLVADYKTAADAAKAILNNIPSEIREANYLNRH